MSGRLVAALFPLSLAFGAALLVKGYSAVGDGFSAGAVAALGAALQYVHFGRVHASRVVGARSALAMATFALLAALAPLLLPALLGGHVAVHYPGPGAAVVKVGAVELHTALLLDAAVAVTVYGAIVATFDRLFPPWPEGDE